MTPEQEKKLNEIFEWFKQMQSAESIPLSTHQAIKERFFGSNFGVIDGGTGATTLTGIVKGNGQGAFTAIVPISGTGSFYVAGSSGASPTVRVDYSNGVITAIV